MMRKRRRQAQEGAGKTEKTASYSRHEVVSTRKPASGSFSSPSIRDRGNARVLAQIPGTVGGICVSLPLRVKVLTLSLFGSICEIYLFRVSIFVGLCVRFEGLLRIYKIRNQETPRCFTFLSLLREVTVTVLMKP